MFCSIIICHIPMRQGVLLTLELDWSQQASEIFLAPPCICWVSVGLQHVPWQQLPLHLGTEDLNSGPHAMQQMLLSTEPFL